MINAKAGSAIQHGAYNCPKTLGCIVLRAMLFRIGWHST
jgi:cytochrome b561